MAKKLIEKKITLFQKVENFFNNHPKALVYIPLIVALLFGLLLFNLRLDEGGDDSAYINRATDFLKDGRFPSFQGPIYPLFLALIIAPFGISLPILKFTSLIFMMFSFFFLIKGLKGRIPHSVLFVSVILLAINSYVLYFSSQTYSEALFMMLQAIYFWRFFRYYDKYPSSNSNVGWSEIKELLILGLLLVVVFETRTIGVMLTLASLSILLLERRLMQTAIIVGVVVLGFLSFKGVEMAFDKGGNAPPSQISTLTYVHPYDLNAGKEDVTGYLMRVVDNSNLYIGKQFLKIIGIKDSTNKEYSVIFTVIFYITIGLGFFYLFRKDKLLLFLSIYLILTLLGTFVSIQKIWDQYRLIIPMIPIIFVLLTLLLVKIFSADSLKELQILFFGVVLVLAVLIVGASVKKIEVGNSIANLTTNKYKGYTPDWENYLKLAEEATKTLPETSYIAVRKPDMARIYCNGKKFYGIYRFNSNDADELVKQLKDNNVTHILIASLRKNPEVNSGDVINTLHRFMSIILQKYPKAFTELKVVGLNNEPAALYQVNYSNTQK